MRESQARKKVHRCIVCLKRRILAKKGLRVATVRENDWKSLDDQKASLDRVAYDHVVCVLLVRLVFSSSATVYRPSEEPLDETKDLGCTNPYGWTKYMIEQILRDFAAANPTFPISILRYFNPVGAHPSGRIGENPHGPPNNLMPFVQQVAVGRRECLSVFGNDYDTPDGTGVRDYIHVDDLAEGHICAMEKLMTMDGGCIIHNLGSGNGYSVLDMVKAFEAASGKSIPYKVVDRRAGDLGKVVANASKAKADFGWETKRGLKEMCESAWKWQSNNPYGYEEAA
ncbi:galE [Symbiodinium microadriaticum]|nr:galE [Symbiodinium sp. KB8]CAE7261956.1 galE [Symbiodinium microadriaticum]